MLEKNSKKRKVQEGLTPEEITIWENANFMLESEVLHNDLIPHPKTVEIQNKKIAFGNELGKKQINGKNIKPTDYLLWHLMIGSTVFEKKKLDTDDHDIENFIKKLYDEYKVK